MMMMMMTRGFRVWDSGCGFCGLEFGVGDMMVTMIIMVMMVTIVVRSVPTNGTAVSIVIRS